MQTFNPHEMKDDTRTDNESKIQSSIRKPEEWVIKYDKANYQSGAGKAVRQLMEIISEYEKEFIEVKRPLVEWIDVDDRMPEPGVKVLTCVTYGLGNQEIGISFTTTRFPDIFDSFLGDRITHWMPLPEPPKNAEDWHSKMLKRKRRESKLL